MKKISILLFPVLLMFIVFSCKNEKTNENNETKVTENVTDSNSDATLQVIYFHGTNRCATCNAVEDNAKNLLETEYSSELENGAITFQSLNMEEEQNKEIVEKYLISYSTLLLIKGEKVTDLTDMAFQYAKNDPEGYKEILKEEIKENL
ncbi:MAG: hypothetical protein JXL97_00110 [Bacteroidales bacterium]|nr:hypothetical protein [Bacteroidales bacterium]